MSRLARNREKVIKMMSHPDRVRNVILYAQADHGKTTAADSLFLAAGLIPEKMAGTALVLDYLPVERERQMTVKTANMSLYIEKRNLLINLIDTPGHVDFSGKVTRAMRIADGAIVIVDAVEGIRAQTEMLTRTAVAEGLKPVLFINKMDRLKKELSLSSQEMLRRITKIVQEFNLLLERLGSPWRVSAKDDTIIFGSALEKWGFTRSMLLERKLTIEEIFRERLFDLFPLPDTLTWVIEKKLLDPISAQKYRASLIWKGDINSPVGRGILSCDPEGPLASLIATMKLHDGRIYGIGRVFSGTIKDHDTIYLAHGHKKSVVRALGLFAGDTFIRMPKIPAGNIMAIEADGIFAGETVSREKIEPFVELSQQMARVVTISVEPKKPSLREKFTKILNMIPLIDPSVDVYVDEKTGEYKISGLGDLHLEIVLDIFKEMGIEIISSEPMVTYKETVLEKGPVIEERAPETDEYVRARALPGKGVIKLPPSTYLSEQIKKGCEWALERGPLCRWPVEGVDIEFTEVKVNSSAEAIVLAKNAVWDAITVAKWSLIEPLFRSRIWTKYKYLGDIESFIRRSEGKIIQINHEEYGVEIICEIPVRNAIGMASVLRRLTSGHVNWTLEFSGWSIMSPESAYRIVAKEREKRGYPELEQVLRNARSRIVPETHIL